MRQYRSISFGLLCLIALLGWSCGVGETVVDDEVVVRYKDNYLTEQQLAFYIPDGIPERDSARYSQQFINQWIKEQAVMDKALSEDEELADRIEYKVQDYKAKLIMHEYETRLVETSLEKEVEDSLVMNFYNSNIEYFKSKEELFCYFYLATTENSLGQVDRWMRSSSIEDLQSLRTWASTNTLEAKLDSAYAGGTIINQLSKGYYGSLKKVGIGQLIQWTGVIQGERRRYRFKLIDVVKAGEYLPISLCKDRIKNSLLNERRVKLIEDTENKIVKDAQAQNHIQR